MKKGQFTEEQIVRILQQAERGEQTIGAICRQHGMAENSCALRAPGWRQKLGGLGVAETQRLRELEKGTSPSEAAPRRTSLGTGCC